MFPADLRFHACLLQAAGLIFPFEILRPDSLVRDFHHHLSFQVAFSLEE